jgi:hypothetical protein
MVAVASKFGNSTKERRKKKAGYAVRAGTQAPIRESVQKDMGIGAGR